MAELPDTAIYALATEDLPSGWDRRPPGSALRAFGDRWLATRESVAMRVPSVVIPDGWNYVINAAHPDKSAALTFVGQPRILEPLSQS